ncbi:MAG: cytochrome c3 family protein [Sulfurovum sp.]|nr:cytochrome c3 family protein [Sulfurovum sp.]
MKIHMLILGLMIAVLMAGCGSSDKNDSFGTSSSNYVLTAGKSSSNYVLTAWNDLGMHCMDGNDFSVFSILPPYNNLHAQLKKKNGDLVTRGVTITFESTTGTDGKINTSSSTKTNFWNFSNKLFPNSNLTADTGLTGTKTASRGPQALTFNATHGWWEAEGIPITPYNDDGSKNYYPLVKVVAKDTRGNILATTKTVLPVSDELDCKRCHASNSTLNDARPTKGWVNNANPEKDFKLNILRLHDQKIPNAVSNNIGLLRKKGYNYHTRGLEATANNGTPVLCAACHKSNALPNVGIGFEPGVNIKAFTAAIHAKHALVKDPTNHNMLLGDSQNRNACYACHPGSQTKCLRGAMGDAKDGNGNNAMQCQSCHGDMHAVGDRTRKGWLDVPNCQACHHTNANGNPVRETSAVLTNGTLRAVVNSKFATMPNTPTQGVSLYRFSKGHGNLQCEACHGSPHAIYPAHNADNLLSKGIQGHAGTIGECTACHASVPNTVKGGPHGMHPVGQNWVRRHEDAAERNVAQCKVCHGQNYRGTVLSKTWTARSFSTEWGQKNFSKGHKISCYDCHNGPEVDNDDHELQ